MAASIIVILLIVALSGTSTGAGATAGIAGGLVLTSALWVAIRVLPPWIALHVPAALVQAAPWCVRAFQWGAGINVVLLGAVLAHHFYRRSLGF